MRHVVIVLRDRGGTKGIGLDQVGTRSKILLVNLLNNVRLRQCQQLIVAFDEDVFAGHREISETLTAIVFFAELVALDHGAHCTIKNQYAA